MYKIFSIMLFLLYAPTIIFAQNKGTTKQDSLTFRKPAVQLKATVQDNKILLRWAVDEPYAWSITYRSGFVVQRFTIARDSKLLSRQEVKFLTSSPIVPKPQEDWLRVFDKNPQAAVVAQCLFGDAPVGLERENFIKQREALMQRFTIALMAADQNFEAAQLAGWGVVDTDVKPNEKYLYQVYSTLPKTKLSIDTGIAVIGLVDRRVLPKPIDMSAKFGNKTVSLSWDYRLLGDVYTNYFVEKSEDSTNFSKATNLPVTIMQTPESEQIGRIYFTDSLATNDKKYFYRVRGVSCFGEIGQPSEIVWGTGRARMIYSPNIEDFTIVNDSTVDLVWRLPKDSTNYLLDYFEISQSNQSESGYKVVKTKIPKTEQTMRIIGLEPANYFTVAAIDRYGEKYTSFPQLVQPIDSTPPAIPIGLEGVVNDSGIVNINWTPNREKDIYGYHIYRGNIATEEFALITKDPTRDSSFVDTVDIKMLNKNVFYKIAALDQRFNQSNPSKVLKVDKPDLIPPPSPQFTDVQAIEGKVILSWDNSPDQDVAAHRVYRLDPANGQWKLLKTLEHKDSTQFTDFAVMGGIQYAYTLVAVDKSKNESEPSQPMTVVVPVDKRNRPPVKDLRALVDRKSEKVLIDWAYEERDVVEFQIYRAYGPEPISLWQVLSTSTRGVVDEKLAINNIYRYAVRAVFADGSMSTWKEVKVNY
jgi:fibronectin type 3 domain-containing protein